MKRSRLWFVSQSCKKEPWSEKSFPGKCWSSYVSGEKKIIFLLLEENESRKPKCCWTQGRAKVEQGQRTVWAIKKKGKRETKHLGQPPCSQSHTMNLSSQFTVRFPPSSLGQSFWEMGCSPWNEEGSSPLCFGHPPVIPHAHSTEGCRRTPRCTRRPFGHRDVLGQGRHTTP